MFSSSWRFLQSSVGKLPSAVGQGQPNSRSLLPLVRRRPSTLPTTSRRRLSSSSEQSSSHHQKPPGKKTSELSIALGFLTIGVIAYFHIRDRIRRQNAVTMGATYVDVPTSFGAQVYQAMPTRLASRVWGWVHHRELPTWMRTPVYQLWTRIFDCKLDEMAVEDLESYKNLNEFFTRDLKPGIRPITGAGGLASPVDARVLICGEVESDNDHLEQVKGMTYTLSAFLGSPVRHWAPKAPAPDKKLFHAVLYLAPGDYHGYHSPVEWRVKSRRHFVGNLFSVNPSIATKFPFLFALNERLVLFGEWEHGFFSMSPVGATNVGSMTLDWEQNLVTNQDSDLMHTYYERTYSKEVSLSKGEHVGKFHLGSTIVLVFEAPQSFQWKVQSGDKISLGQRIGEY